MPLETYDLCPGGTGKKIKFCGCKDLVHSLDKAIAAIEGDQRAAALAQLDRLQEAHPDRACVLALKAGCQFAMDDFEAAEPTVASFISHYPDNPLALSQSAILHALDGDLDNAVVKVQRAIESSSDHLPYTVHEAIGITGRLFVQRGNILAGRAHLTTHAAYSDEEDTRSASLLMRLHSLPEVPVLLKEDHFLHDRPEDAAWGKPFDEAAGLAERGAWLAAVERLEELAQQHDGEPTLLNNIAVLNSWLGRNELAVAAWRRYASLDGLSLDDAVEAEATAQLLEEPAEADLVERVQIIYPVLDIEKLLERLASDKHFVHLPVDSARFAQEGQPPPKAVYVWLDRPPLDSTADISRDNAPRVEGQLVVFGRETDRQPRLEVIATKIDSFEQGHENLRSRLDGLIGTDGDERVVGRATRLQQAVDTRFWLPEVPPDQRMEIQVAHREDVILKQWPSWKQSLFDGQSAEEVCGDAKYRIRLLGAILVMKVRDPSTGLPPMDFNGLREKLGLPKREKIDPWTIKDVSQCPLVRIPLLDMLKLADDDLVELYLRAGRLGAAESMRLLAEEVEGRPSLEDKADKVEVYEILAGLTKDDAKALDYIKKARELAVGSGASAARWLLVELEMRLDRGQPEGVQELLQTLQRKYMQEPGVGQELLQILVKFGLVNPDGSPAQMPAQPQPAGVAEEPVTAGEPGKIWTPDEQSAASGPGEEKSKLWLPGME